MSDPEVPQPEKPADVNDVVDSAKAGLEEAAAAGADVPAETADAPVDPDLAAFEAAEREHPGTFGALPDGIPAARDGIAGGESPSVDTPVPAASDDEVTEVAVAATTTDALNERANIVAEEPYSVTSVYDQPSDAETHVLPSEPVVAAAAAPAALQPIFVQAPEPPRDRGNRGTAGAIGLLATAVFAALFLGVVLALGAIQGDVTGANIGEAALAPLTTWGFWTPVVVFFLSFWLLGAIINRGRWGLWVVFGLLVGVASYFGFILGQLFEAPFWMITASQGAELVNEQLFSPLAIAAFVLGRELTIWFGAWVARSGARKTELNAEAQREYERTLEAGPTLPR
ncbi:ABC transporter [Microbacterium sp. CIAB417]|uniref:ABC transporter n=1 Tax=Microbacterium sp. CIAB417 TaxID=2860287 RepID=UPI001FAB8976|nr:ABC transporter [Microbacterium sp. CIAB417]